jgi:hypothetical protein
MNAGDIRLVPKAREDIHMMRSYKLKLCVSAYKSMLHRTYEIQSVALIDELVRRPSQNAAWSCARIDEASLVKYY